MKRIRIFTILLFVSASYILLINKKYSLLEKSPEEPDPWAKLPHTELLVRMYHGDREVYEDILVPSMKLFWPNEYIKTVIVLDNEKPEDHQYAPILRSQFPYPRIEYEDPIPSFYNTFIGKTSGEGHKRQQWTKFHADLYTTADYVSFVDTDTLFITPVIPEVMFENGKPIVTSVIEDRVDSHFWAVTSFNTGLWFNQTKEVMRCMTYFPVTIKVEHLVHLRKWTQNYHNQSFSQVFDKLLNKTDGMMCEFNIMCQFIWIFHREEYSFHIQNVTKKDKSTLQENRKGQQYYQKHVTPKMLEPFPRPGMHCAQPFSQTKRTLTVNW